MKWNSNLLKVIATVIILLSIICNALVNLYIFKTNNSDWLFSVIFQPFKEMQYGYWLAKRWFVPAVAIITLIIWVTEKGRGINYVRANLKYMIFVATALVAVRILSYTHWFYMDDFKFLGNFLRPPTNDIQYISCCGDGFPAQWMMYLVMRWFRTNFYLYNTLGLITIFAISQALFVISSMVQKSKIVSLLVALFFVTTPTYFHATTAMVDYIGDTFSLFLFTISIYFIFKKTYLRSLIFAAAALEFGLSRTHFIALPLIALTTTIGGNSKIKKIAYIGALILVSLQYFVVLGGREAGEYNSTSFYLDITNIKLSTNLAAHTILPFPILKAIGLLFRTISTSTVFSPAIGAILLIIISALVLQNFVTKRWQIFCLSLLGSLIIFGSLVFPPMFGVRVDRNLAGFTRELVANVTPLPSTGYGLFPAFGISIILLAYLASFRKALLFRLIVLGIIIFNGVSFVYSDFMWSKIHVKYDKVVNSTLKQFVPIDGETRVILLDPSASVIRRSIQNFITIYRPWENIILVDEEMEFTRAIQTYTPSENHIYKLTYDGYGNKITLMSSVISPSK